MGERVVMDRDEVDRLVLMRSDLDRYEAQLIPDLQQEALALRNALSRLVAAVQEAEQVLSLEATLSHRGALRSAERLLAEPGGHGWWPDETRRDADARGGPGPGPVDRAGQGLANPRG